MTKKPLIIHRELDNVIIEQEPCEDCISRQAAIDVLRNTEGVISPLSDDIILINKADALTKLIFLPKVQPSQKVRIINDKR